MSEEKKWDFCGRVTEKQSLIQELVEREDAKGLIGIEIIQKQNYYTAKLFKDNETGCRIYQGKKRWSDSDEGGASPKRHRTTGRLFARENSG